MTVKQPAKIGDNYKSVCCDDVIYTLFKYMSKVSNSWILAAIKVIIFGYPASLIDCSCHPRKKLPRKHGGSSGKSEKATAVSPGLVHPISLPIRLLPGAAVSLPHHSAGARNTIRTQIQTNRSTIIHSVIRMADQSLQALLAWVYYPGKPNNHCRRCMSLFSTFQNEYVRNTTTV